MSNEMSSLERVHAALSHESMDRVPISAMGWTIGAMAGGYSTKEYSASGEKMGKSQVALQKATGIDLLHPTSDVGQMAEGWGVKMLYKEGLTPMLGEFSIVEPEQWETMEAIDPLKDGRMHVTIEAVSYIRERLPDISIMPYVPCPLTSATHVRAMEEVMIDILLFPDMLHKGLKVITESTVAYIDEIIVAGADGVLFAPTRASAEITTIDQYREFGAFYDHQVLEALKKQDGMNILHVCGVEPMFGLLSEYPNANGINWWDRGSNLNIAEAKQAYGTKICLVAGLDQTNELLYGTEEEIVNQTKDAIENGFADGTGLIIAPGCEISPQNSLERIRASVKAAHKYGVWKG